MTTFYRLLFALCIVCRTVLFTKIKLLLLRFGPISIKKVIIAMLHMAALYKLQYTACLFECTNFLELLYVHLVCYSDREDDDACFLGQVRLDLGLRCLDVRLPVRHKDRDVRNVGSSAVSSREHDLSVDNTYLKCETASWAVLFDLKRYTLYTRVKSNYLRQATLSR